MAQICQLPVDLLQFHGDETPEQCQFWGKPYIKALRMKEGVDIAAELALYRSAKGLLLDAYRAGVPGGTGESFDWQRIPAQYCGQMILAGGLTPDNIAQAVTTVRPYAVDVSGGVEDSPGIKDAEKIQAFVAAVQQADQQ